MFAVIKTGGKQYRVVPDQTVTIERIEGNEGSRVEFAQVLMVGEGSDVSIGTPAVDGARVTAEVVEQGRGPKVISFKKRRRQNSRRKKGHRQLLTTVSILEILTDGTSPSRDASGKSAEDRRRERDAAYVASREGVNADDFASDDAASGASEGDATDAAADDAGLIEPAAEPARSATASETEEDAADEHAEEQAAMEATAGRSTDDEAPSEKPEGPLFQAPEGEKDKLTRIKGIGPVAERQLNEQGITTFAQIANLTDEDIERVDAYMPFSAAQIRAWQEQARELTS